MIWLDKFLFFKLFKIKLKTQVNIIIKYVEPTPKILSWTFKNSFIKIFLLIYNFVIRLGKHTKTLLLVYTHVYIIKKKISQHLNRLIQLS